MVRASCDSTRGVVWGAGVLGRLRSWLWMCLQLPVAHPSGMAVRCGTRGGAPQQCVSAGQPGAPQLGAERGQERGGGVSWRTLGSLLEGPVSLRSDAEAERGCLDPAVGCWGQSLTRWVLTEDEMSEQVAWRSDTVPYSRRFLFQVTGSPGAPVSA